LGSDSLAHLLSLLLHLAVLLLTALLLLQTRRYDLGVLAGLRLLSLVFSSSRQRVETPSEGVAQHGAHDHVH
ncbi:hypothetical protein PMAYCL1PPCAC_33281, partial [Pristionchus mayeri]